MQITPQQAAEMAGVTRPTIMRAITSGELPATRSNRGNKWQIKPDDLAAWIAKNPKKPPTPKAEKAEPYTANAENIQNKDSEQDGQNISRISHLESEVEALQGRLQEARDELAKERGRAEEKDATIALLSGLLRDAQARQAAPPAAAEAPARRSWWPWGRT